MPLNAFQCFSIFRLKISTFQPKITTFQSKNCVFQLKTVFFCQRSAFFSFCNSQNRQKLIIFSHFQLSFPRKMTFLSWFLVRKVENDKFYLTFYKNDKNVPIDENTTKVRSTFFNIFHFFGCYLKWDIFAS